MEAAGRPSGPPAWTGDRERAGERTSPTTRCRAATASAVSRRQVGSPNTCLLHQRNVTSSHAAGKTQPPTALPVLRTFSSAPAQSATRSECAAQGSRRLVQSAVCLTAQGCGGGQEGMGHIRIAGGPRRHARSGSLPGLPLAFVSERVERGRDHQGGRQVCEGSGEQRARHTDAGGRPDAASDLPAT